MTKLAKPASLLQTQQGQTLVLTLNVPEKRNALTRSIRKTLLLALIQAEQNELVKAIVLTGASGTFCAGGDLSQMPTTVMAGRRRMQENGRLISQMMQMSKPIVAAVEGWAIGAGLSLALACDSIVAANTAQFGSGFGKVGLLPDLGLCHTLMQRVSMAEARSILFFGESITAGEAARMGLIDFIVAPEIVLAEAMNKAKQLSELAPLPLAMMKLMLAQGLDAALAAEVTQQSQLFVSADHEEGKQAFFAKRPPTFKGE